MKRAALALLALAVSACTGDRDADGQGGYVVESVERGRVESAVTATGTVNPLSSVQVGTYVSGPIRAIDVDFNSVVTRGQRVAKIDPAPFQVKVQRAEASVANARARVVKDRADLSLKKLTWERNLELLPSHLISQNDVDMARSAYEQALAQIELDTAAVRQAEADLDEARINLAYTDITSPVNGVVVSRNVNVGQTVAATFQTPTLFLIAEDLTKMQVDTSVSESDIGAVKDGQAARFVVDAYPGKQFEGIVAQVRNAPTTIQNVVTYDVVVAVDNPSLELKPGMTANVTILTAQRDDALRVSARALRFNPEPTPAASSARPSPAAAGPGLWLLQADGSVQRTAVEIGVRNDEYVEIVSGNVTEGAQVAIALKRSARRTPQAQSIPGMPRYR